MIETSEKKLAGPIIRLHPNDNIVVARVDVAIGRSVPSENFTSRSQVPAGYKIATKKILKGEPIQYILGYAWFRDLVFKVNNDVLIPRPETEELVSWVLEEQATQESFLDIGTGSGCIAVSIKNALKQATVFALDVSPEALEVAKYNAKQNACVLVSGR